MLSTGTEFDGFRIERFVARGGMGEVYEATQLSFPRRVALKVIATEFASDSRFRERFLCEGETLARLRHPSILPVYKRGDTPDGRLYVAMQFVGGENLQQRLDRVGGLGPHALGVLTQLAAALDAAHRAGLVHLDVKPANVMLEHDRDTTEHGKATERAFLTDFGLVKRLDAGAAAAGPASSGWGTPDYMAPEQIQRGAVDARTDVYAFGATAYHAITGRPPYPGSPRAVERAHLSAPPPLPSELLPGLDPAFDKLVAQAMAKAPANRPHSPLQLIEAIERPPPRPRRLTRRLAIAIVPPLVLIVPLVIYARATFPVHSISHQPVLLDPASAPRRHGPFFIGDRVGIGAYWIEVTHVTDPLPYRAAPPGMSFPGTQPRPGDRWILVELTIGNQSGRQVASANLGWGESLRASDGRESPGESLVHPPATAPSERIAAHSQTHGAYVFSVRIGTAPRQLSFSPYGLSYPPETGSADITLTRRRT